MPDMTPTEREAETARLRAMMEAGIKVGLPLNAIDGLACDWPKLADALDAALARAEKAGAAYQSEQDAHYDTQEALSDAEARVAELEAEE